MELDLRQFLRIALRRWWIFALLTVVCGTTAYVISSRQDEQYRASARVVVLAGQAQAGAEYSSLLASLQLAETYRLLIETGPVLDRVIDKLELPYDYDELDRRVSTEVVGDTQVIEVRVEDTDPEQAARIATSIVDEFQQYITSQVDERIGAQVEVADPARVPTKPFEPRPMFAAVLGLLAGLLVGVVVVAAVEYLDNTVKPETDVQGIAHAPVLATVANVPKLEAGHAQIYAMEQPRSAASEAVRLLRTNIEFAAASEAIGTVAITSPGPNEGKSTVVANLGVVMAQAGLSTVVLDADLRKPTLHRIFGLGNERGVTTLLAHPEEPWRSAASQAGLPRLELVPSGPLPPNPFDLVSSPRFASLLERIRQDVDLVLIDTPPVLSASDSLAMARHTDGVIMICRSHVTRGDALRAAAQAVHQGGIRLIGVVLNRQKGQQGSTYYGQYYGEQTGSSDSDRSADWVTEATQKQP